MVQRPSDQRRSEPMPRGAAERPSTSSEEVADITIYRDERSLLDGQPHTQEFIVTDVIGRTLLVKLTSEGEATLRQVNMRDTTFLHLPADFLRAFVFQTYEWLCDVERWNYEQEVKAQQPHGPTQDHEPGGITTGMVEDAYQNDLLSEEEFHELHTENAWIAANIAEE